MGHSDVSAGDAAGDDPDAGSGDANGTVDSTDGADARADADDAFDRAVAALAAGEPIAVHDFDDREAETDLFYPAFAVDAGAIARLRLDAGGLLCVALAPAVADAADLPFLADAVDHPATEDTALAYGDRSSFSLPVNHVDTFTGVTDEDRALTISELGAYAGAVDGEGAITDEGTTAGDGATADVGASADDGDAPAERFAESFRVPGHVHLLRAADGGLAERAGHTELAVALADAAGIAPAVVVCEMLDDETGEALSLSDARAYAERTDTPFLEGERIVAALR